MKSLAVVFHEANQPTLEQVDVPALSPDEVRIKTSYSGVSIGTEQSIFSGRRVENGTFPFVGGYMSTGVVQEVGSQVTFAKVGDEVAASSGGRLDGEINAIWGAHMATRVVQEKCIYPLPDELSLRDAAMFVIPAVGLNALRQIHITDEHTVVVQGQGLIGQFMGQWLRARGATVIAIEPDPLRAELSRRYVTPHVLHPAENGETREKIMELTEGRGADVVVEATGNSSLIRQATSLLRTGSHMMFLGWYNGEITLDYHHHFHANQVTAHFPMGDGDRQTIRVVLDALARGILTVGDNITHVVPSGQACDVYEKIIAGDRSMMGVVIDWSQV